MSHADKELLKDLHQPRWSATWLWFGFILAFFTGQGLLAWAVYTGTRWLYGPLILLLAHVMHSHLIAFHEAAHGVLSPSRWLNDLIGLFIGYNGFMSLSLYRAAHHSHHAYLASERDEELWPFVIPGTPRWLRCFAAAMELGAGLIYTPLLFLRAFLRPGSPIANPSIRKRIHWEFAFLVAIWITVFAVVAWWNAWTYLLIVYVIPAWLAGNLQSWRKYIEHMGLTGHTALSSTRSIVPRSVLGRFVAFTLFNEPYHGVHHKFGQLPQGALPVFKSLLRPQADDEQPPYPSYRDALVQMIGTLRDPRVGAQWLRSQPSLSRSPQGHGWLA